MKAEELFKITREIYNNCEDELSKVLYMDKILYAVSGDERYIHKLVEDSMPDFAHNLNKIGTDDKVIIYGAGDNMEIAVSICKDRRIPVAYVCDRDVEKQGKLYKEIPIISPEDLIKNHQDAIVLISTTTYLEEVKSFLGDYFPQEKIIPFADEKQMYNIKMQYFDEVLPLEDGEVFVDGGCFGFETSKILLDKCKAKKIYAFEPDKENQKKVSHKVNELGLSNVEIIPAGMWNCNTTLHFSSQGSILSRVAEDGEDEIKAVAVDEVIDEKVTFIKMDIEGSELNALHGAAETIKRYKPKLAICIYHKLEDIIEIPQYIHSLVPEYKFYVRHYSFGAAETVLYAII